MSRFRSCYMDRADDTLTGEILDFLVRHATCLCSKDAEDQPRLQEPVRHQNKDISDSASCIRGVVRVPA
jgi:hypothetical protein